MLYLRQQQQISRSVPSYVDVYRIVVKRVNINFVSKRASNRPRMLSYLSLLVRTIVLTLA